MRAELSFDETVGDGIGAIAKDLHEEDTAAEARSAGLDQAIADWTSEVDALRKLAG